MALLLREFRVRWPLYLILIVTAGVFADAMDSPFYGDDYFYLVAARELSFDDYLRAAFTPWGHQPLLPFTRDYWRPLSFTWFEVAQPMFGTSVAPYHLANLIAHLLSATFVWMLADRLDARATVRVIAVAVFALYPGSFEAVTWISSVNSAGLTLALAGWLASLLATEQVDSRGRRSQWWLAASVCLVALGLCFRETAIVLVPAMVLWYLLVQRRATLREWRTYLPLLPFAALALGYYLVRTRLLSEPFANPDIYGYGDGYLDRYWYYARNAFAPFRDPVHGWRLEVQRAAALVLFAIPFGSLLRRRWDVLALSLGLLASIVPLGGTLLGIGVRYFYFSTPLVALLLAVLLTDAVEWLVAAKPAIARVAPAALAGAILVAGGTSTYLRLDHWESSGPEQEQAWIDSLRAAYPELPRGGTLYCANVPLVLQVFGAANLLPTVRWYYPEIGAVAHYKAADPPRLGPDDRFFDPGLPGVSLAQP